MTLNEVVKNSYNCSNCYLQVLINPDTGDFRIFEHSGLYVNSQLHLKNYFTVGNFFRKLTKREIAEITYEFLSKYLLRRDVFLKKYSKWVL